MPLVHFLRHGSNVSRSKGGRLATMGEEDGAGSDEFFSGLEFALKTTKGILWVCSRAMRDFHIISF